MASGLGHGEIVATRCNYRPRLRTRLLDQRRQIFIHRDRRVLFVLPLVNADRVDLDDVATVAAHRVASATSPSETLATASDSVAKVCAAVFAGFSWRD